MFAAGSPQIVLAQVDPGTPAGVQDVAPAGGLTVQDGVTTEATLCPDGSKAVPQDAPEDLESTEKAGENKRYLCPDTAATTTDAGVDAAESATGTPTPTMK